MRYAIISDGTVSNVAVAETDFATEQGWVAIPDGYGPGDLYDGTEFSHPDPVTVYQPLEPWRFWAVVALTPGLGEDNLRAAIDSLSDATFKAIALAKLDNPPGGVFSRADPLFSNTDLQAALGMDDDAIDALWSAAQELPA